jgi:hypothetical protein
LPAAREVLSSEGIELISYRDLAVKPGQSRTSPLARELG